MTDLFHLWTGGAIFSFGAQFMSTPAHLTGGDAREPCSRHLQYAWFIEGYVSTLVKFCFALSVGLVWYEKSFVSAAVFVSAPLPGLIAYDLLWDNLERLRLDGRVVAVACLQLAPLIAGLGAYMLAGDMIDISRLHAN